MKLFCPVCKTVIPARDVQLDTGWDKCESCQEVFALTEQIPGFHASLSPPRSVERPNNARTVMEDDPHRLLLHLPRKGVRSGTRGVIFFATIWLAFITFWTLGALGVFFNDGNREVNWGFAGFSIPFWLVGIGMVIGILWDISHTRTICLTAVAHWQSESVSCRSSCLISI